MAEQSQREVLRSMTSKQFVIWTAVFVPLYVVAVLAFESIGAEIVVVFTSGMIFAWFSDMAVEEFVDWYWAAEVVDDE